MIFKEKPEMFNPIFEVACCHVNCNGKFLMLHRADHKSAGNKWGVPAGKIMPGESPLETAKRETKEETGIDIPAPSMEFRNTVYVRYPEYDFVYHIFQTEIQEIGEVLISKDEHKDFRWLTPNDALALGESLVPDEDACIRLVYAKESEGLETSPLLAK